MAKVILSFNKNVSLILSNIKFEDSRNNQIFALKISGVEKTDEAMFHLQDSQSIVGFRVAKSAQGIHAI